MSKISCRMRNSFGINSNGKLYSWGSWETGLLGKFTESDATKPDELFIKSSSDYYRIDGVSAGHFHCAVVANREGSHEPRNNKYAVSIIKKLFTWYTEYFVPNSSNVISFFKVLLRKSENTKSEIKYDVFESLVLEPFFSFLKIKNKDIFNMRAIYKEKLSMVFGEISTKQFISPADLMKLLMTEELSLKEIIYFGEYCVKRFKTNPEDFPFFINLIMQFKPFITCDDLRNLFEYCYISEANEGGKIFLTEQDCLSKILQIFNDLRIEDKIPLNDLIDFLLGKQTGIGTVFTWGAYSECRLGYPDNQSLKGEDEGKLQRIPKIVRFKDIFTRIKKISCGYAHTLALSDASTVLSWGSGKYGSLGNSKSDNIVVPEMIERDFDKNIFKDILDVASGMYYSIALDNTGKLFTWGCGNNGRLGHGDENSVGNPKLVRFFHDQNIKIMKIACGDTHTAALTTAKHLYTFGNGNFGKLGLGSFDDLKLPTHLEFFNNKKIELVACGSQNTIAILTDYRIFAWGKNSHGMLGVPQMVDQNILIPQELNIQRDDNNSLISEISLGTMHSMILFSNGSLYTCGNTVNGILGQPDVYDKISFFKKIESHKFNESEKRNIFNNTIFRPYNTDFTLNKQKQKYATHTNHVACSNLNTAFVTNNGELYMCGDPKLICEPDIQDKIEQKKDKTEDGENDNSPGENNTNENPSFEDRPFKISNRVLAEKVTYIALGKNHVICVADKKAFSWGKNVYGVLGLASKNIGESVNQPNLIDKITTSVKMACASDTHSMVLTGNGEIYAFGSNLYGKLGIGDISKYFEFATNLDHPCETEPQIVKNISFAEYIACSNGHSACIMKYDYKFELSYSVYTWGSNYLGKLGHINGGECYEPRRIEDLDNKLNEGGKLYFVKVALGDDFSLALDVKGGLWGWGKKKYLDLRPNINVDDNAIVNSPIGILTESKFVFMTCSNYFITAIDVNGIMYNWGKTFVSGKPHYNKVEKLFCEKMLIAACSTNHYCSVDKKAGIPFTWGNNIYYKCGQPNNVEVAKDNKNNIEDQDENVITGPKKIEYFFDYFVRNSLQLEIEKEHEKGGNNKSDYKDNDQNNREEAAMESDTFNPDDISNTQKKQISPYDKRHKIQSLLLDERTEYKNKGLILEDIKINKTFYETLSEYLTKVRSIEELRETENIKIENKIISMINHANSRKNDTYRSEIPKILSQNFQIYETFLTILQIHPCFLKQVYSSLPNKSSFIEIIKMVFGRNFINLRNKRVILMLLGLWNSIFQEETNPENSNNLKETDRYEDFVTYDLYDLIFKINKENTILFYDISCEIFLYFITRLIEKSKNTIKEEILSQYKDLGDLKREICEGAIKIITDKISSLFTEVKDLKNNFSFSVVWMFKKISDLYISEDEEKISNTNNFSKIFNYFLFVPFTEIFRKLRDTYDENLCPEYNYMIKRFPEVLDKLKKKQGFSQLFNYYNNDKKSVESAFFRKVCSGKSDILKQIYEIFINLSRSDYSKTEVITQKAKDNIIKMNLTCQQFLNEFQFEFTLNAFREQIKSISEIGNENVIIPLTIKDIIQLQTSFLKLLNNNSISSFDTGPFRDILNIMNDFKLDDLENNSNIGEFVVNIYIKPNMFFLNSNMQDVKVVKCESCLLPVLDIFFPDEEVKEYVNGKNWNCKVKNCNYLNDKQSVVCGAKNCNSLKSKESIREQKSFFKQFTVPHDEKIVLLFEEVLSNMQLIEASDDILKEIDLCLDRLRSNKLKDNVKINNIVSFRSLIYTEIGLSEDSNKQEARRVQVLNELYHKVNVNVESRHQHLVYLNSLDDFLKFMFNSADNAKANFVYNQKSNESFIFNVGRGFSNDFLKNQSVLHKVFLDNMDRENIEKNNVIKKFLVADLVRRKVIDEILFHNQPQPKLMQKSYILFEKEEKGYNMKLNYKEKYRKFIICGVNKHEFILEDHFMNNEAILGMRRNTRNNPTINYGDIRFNIFYLVKLLNSLETE